MALSDEVSRAILTAVLGLLGAGTLALLNSWITARSGVDEDLRTQRLNVYPALWKKTSAVSVWPREELTRTDLEELHRSYRSWYYADGGLYLSQAARDRYGDVQELIDTLLGRTSGRPTDRLATDAYTDLMTTTSALRTALTEDLDTRRRRSLLETWRRSWWHDRSCAAARERIERARHDPDAWSQAGSR